MAKKSTPAGDALPSLPIWKDNPDDDDYRAAKSYLGMILPQKAVDATVERMKLAPRDYRKAKDIIRASRLELLPMANEHVREKIVKIVRGEKLRPVLLVRGDARAGVPLLIADGYHRVCAAYHLDEDTAVPCRMVKITRVTRRAKADDSQT